MPYRLFGIPLKRYVKGSCIKLFPFMGSSEHY